MKIHQWNISHQVVALTERAVQKGPHEVFTIWTATKPDGEVVEQIKVDQCIVPAQTPGTNKAGGVWVHINGQELQRIQLDNFRAGRRSVIQLHTHPSADVRMSALDREWEVVRHVGALSIIVPNYGRSGLRLGDGANVYEREESDWRLWSQAETRERLVIS